ncbi:hypothetical protein L7F22_040325 [Adiantum nelumboides]|nr:hypothetical protein [Adiantum nelumboides]
MQSRDSQGRNPPSEHVSRVAATNDGTLNAIVNKSVHSVDVPLARAASQHDDEMLSWLHYPLADSLDRGYCSDIFGDLPNSSALLVTQFQCPTREFGLRLPIPRAPFNTGVSLASSMLSHGTSTSINTCTVATESTRDMAESCGSRSVEASFRVAGADAVLGLGICQAAGVMPSCVGTEGFGKLDTPGDVVRKADHAKQLICNSSSANETLCTQSEGSQTPSQIASRQEGSLSSMTTLSCVPKPLDMNCFTSPIPTGKHGASNFEHFSRTAVESKVSLHVLRESSGPTNIERVRQQTGQHVVAQESTFTCNMSSNLEAVPAKWLPPCVPLRPLLPLPRPLPPLLPSSSSFSAAVERSHSMPARWSPTLPPPSSSVGESRDGTNVSKDTSMCARISTMSAEKGTRTADQASTSPSRCSGSSTKKWGEMTENMSTKPMLITGEDSDYQSEYVEELAATEKKSPSIVKRLRTAEMHNQSERKRRVKINDKLKILQQLIPNGNKPDKASLLDAVIEYIKLLQSQLQVISTRTGIGIPTGMIPNGNVHHLQMPAFAHMRIPTDMGMGVGLGMGMTMEMGMMDANGAAMGTGCTIMPMPLFPGPPPIPHTAALHPADCGQSPGVMNLYVGQSHVQHPMMNQNSPIYSSLQQQPRPPIMQPQQQHLSRQSKQTPQLPSNPGKKPF